MVRRPAEGSSPVPLRRPGVAERSLGGPPLRSCTEGSDEYTRSIVMATSVHLPKSLLQALDRRAQTLRISRNRLIVKALERELAESSEWSSGFFEELAQIDAATQEAVDEMLIQVRGHRSSKGPPKL